MKQLLFLLLFPCLALAQYQGNANQKITLGEQTTADGLVWRGLLADTANLLTNKLDTSVYIVLDTGTRAMWYYRASTTPKWTRLVDSLNNLQGTLSVAKGGTGSTTQNFVDLTTPQSVGGSKTFTSAVTATRFNPTSSTVTGTGMFLPSANTLGLSTNSVNQQTLHPNGMTIFKPTPQNLSTTFRLIEIGAQGSIYSAPGAAGRFNDYTFALGYYWDASGNARYMNTETNLTHQPIKLKLYQGSFTIDNSVVGTKDSIITFTRILTLNELGRLGIGESSPTEKLHVVGNARISGLANAANPVNVQVDVNGVLVRTSSIDIKEDVQNLPYGLNEIMLLQPSKFSYIDKYKYGEGYDIGFIAQDVNNVIPEAVGTGIESDIFMDSVKLIPVLTKAIQEQQALIKALEQRILILENK